MLILTSSNTFVTKHFVQHLPKSPKDLRLTFIPTAAEVEEGDKSWLDDDRNALKNAGFQVTDFSVAGKTKEQVKQMLDSTDFVFVSGGNTFYLLQEMNKSGFNGLIQEYVKKGMLYGGTSAGSVVAGPTIRLVEGFDEVELAPELKDYTGLGLTDACILPHWGSDYFKQKYEVRMKAAYKPGLKIILLTDDQYLLVEDDGKYRVESM